MLQTEQAMAHSSAGLVKLTRRQLRPGQASPSLGTAAAMDPTSSPSTPTTSGGELGSPQIIGLTLLCAIGVCIIMGVIYFNRRRPVSAEHQAQETPRRSPSPPHLACYGELLPQPYGYISTTSTHKGLRRPPGEKLRCSWTFVSQSRANASLE